MMLLSINTHNYQDVNSVLVRLFRGGNIFDQEGKYALVALDWLGDTYLFVACTYFGVGGSGVGC
jgi:hypothetical protein